eukprot:Anaeramoba_ignava/a607994_38.p1 GENE.a607994_38~~a607994_38.p1  ORF type:complete len:273 (+),score=106.05 a607994_38:53-871(+)
MQRFFSTITKNPGRLFQQTAIVTGSGSGIGRALALGFAKEGANVGVTDLNMKGADETVEMIKKQGGNAMSAFMDVTNEKSIKEAVDKVTDKYNDRLDVMVMNAGIQHIDPIHKLDQKDWRKVLSVHLDGSFLCTKEAVKKMYPQKSGSLIYIGSVHSKTVSKLKAPYCSAKHGMLGLARVVAKEAAEYNVKANLILPGYVFTPLVEKQIPEQAKELGISEKEVIKNVMLKDTFDYTFTSLNDLSEIAIFFATFPSLAISGQSLIASHGSFFV